MKPLSLSWVSCASFMMLEFKFDRSKGEVGFCEGKKTGEPAEQPSEQG